MLKGIFCFILVVNPMITMLNFGIVYQNQSRSFYALKFKILIRKIVITRFLFLNGVNFAQQKSVKLVTSEKKIN